MSESYAPSRLGHFAAIWRDRLAKASEGIRILDLTRGPAGGLATMILADFGAEVVVIDGPNEDPLLDLPAAPMWRRGRFLLIWTLMTPATLNSSISYVQPATCWFATGEQLPLRESN